MIADLSCKGHVGRGNGGEGHKQRFGAKDLLEEAGVARGSCLSVLSGLGRKAVFALRWRRQGFAVDRGLNLWLWLPESSH